MKSKSSTPAEVSHEGDATPAMVALPDLMRHLTAFNEAAAAVMAARTSFSDVDADTIAMKIREVGLLMSPADPSLVSPALRRGSITPPLPG